MTGSKWGEFRLFYPVIPLRCIPDCCSCGYLGMKTTAVLRKIRKFFRGTLEFRRENVYKGR